MTAFLSITIKARSLPIIVKQATAVTICQCLPGGNFSLT
jgi:hypothetical protein